MVTPILIGLNSVKLSKGYSLAHKGIKLRINPNGFNRVLKEIFLIKNTIKSKN